METEEEHIASVPSSPEIKCEPPDEDFEPSVPLGAAQAIAVQGFPLQQQDPWTQTAFLAEPSEHAREKAFFLETLRQLDPREATPHPFIHIMAKAAPNGLPYPQVELQKTHDAPFLPQTVPQTAFRSQITPSPSAYAMPHSQTASQHQTTTHATPQLVLQPANEPTIAGVQAMYTHNHCNPTNFYSSFTRAASQNESVCDKVQYLVNSQIHAEGYSSGGEDVANKSTYGELSIPFGVSGRPASDIPEQATTQPGLPAQPNDFHPKPLQIVSPIRSRTTGTPFVASSGAPVRSSLDDLRNPISQSFRPSPTSAVRDNDEPLSMRKDEPVDFTWMVDQAEAELGWTGKYDNDPPTRRRSRAVLAASQIDRILKKLDGKMVRHTSFPNRVHILTVMREIIQAVLETPTTSDAGDEAQTYLAHYEAQFLAAVDKMTPGQRNRLKILEGGQWMRELLDTTRLAEGLGVSGDLEQAIIRIDC
ncbi:hypothetical protein PG993_006722 [Apiospora rasikravindrae]|uniref:Uncharacterized protein n=1 Tax=Apiospora rasikravindrae TaxID=990691 RepID=A0ABR1T8Q1_9PEZI